jgi:hypothetical protein
LQLQRAGGFDRDRLHDIEHLRDRFPKSGPVPRERVAAARAA